MSDPIQCLLVDDKPLALDILTDYVAQVPALAAAIIEPSRIHYVLGGARRNN